MTGATLNFCLSKNLFPVKQSTLSSFALVFSDNECALVEMVYILKKKKTEHHGGADKKYRNEYKLI